MKNNKEINENKSGARRQIIKSVAVGGGVFATGSALPGSWVKPMLDTVVLPAHAQTSLPPITGVYGGASIGIVLNSNDSKVNSYALLDMLISPAAAQSVAVPPVLNNHLVEGLCGEGEGDATFQIYFRINEDTSVDVAIQRVSGDNDEGGISSGCLATTTLVDNSTIMDVSIQLDDDEFLNLSAMTATETTVTGTFMTAAFDGDDDGPAEPDADYDPCSSSFTALLSNEAFPMASECGDDD
jgi:hypothetical protein